MTPDEKYFFFNRENPGQHIEILSNKLKIFSQFSTEFAKSTFNFKHFEKKR